MNSRRLILVAALAALAAAYVASTVQAGVSLPKYRWFCTVGTFRCMSGLRTDLPIVADATDAHSGLGAPDLRAAYRLASSAATRGAGQTVALVDAYDDPTIESDLATYRAYYGLPSCTTANGCFKKVNQDGEQGNYPIVANPSWEPEIALDTSALPRSRTATARPGRSRIRPSSTTTTTTRASRSPLRQVTRTTGWSGRRPRRT